MTIGKILQFLEKKQVSFRFEGDVSAEIAGFSSLKNYKINTVTWAKNELAYRYDFADKLLVIAQEGLEIAAKNIIISKESKRAFFLLVEYMAGETEPIRSAKESIGIGTVIGARVKLGENVVIGHNCVIDGNISIGNNTRIWHNVTIINNVTIGADCEIQSGCVIGHDGFAWNEDSDHVKTMIRHFGGVEIGNRVHIGPNCTIDRGEIDNTVIQDGVKMGQHCVVAHNVIIGKNVLLITGCKLHGSSEMGENAYLVSAIVRNQCKIGENAFIGMGAVVTSDISAGVVAFGVPAKVNG